MRDKHIVVGICGSIAAYKAAILVRALVKAGAEVKVIMTSSASAFISPLTLSTLSKNEVYSSLVNETGDLWINHVEIAKWADLLLVAPATAETMAKFAHGNCDNLLTAVYLSAICQVMIAPAMDLDMWTHPATVNNLKTLISYGNQVIQPGVGELASGLEGAGRLAEPEVIAQAVQLWFDNHAR